jgi:leucyl/phenylalanyl-tRNA--protein transferase
VPVYLLGPDPVFPPPERADPSGLLAVGGDLHSERLLLAYSLGIFPWYSEGQPLLWFSPDPRTVLLPDRLHVPRSLRRRMRQSPYELRLDTAFGDVIRACAAVSRPDQDGTWITPEMVVAYELLFEQGYAHSVEAFESGELVGGLYGVSLGAGFFGESMFALRSDASKIAFVALIHQLRAWDFDLIDCQIHTEHLARFGAEEWPREDFLEALRATLRRPAVPRHWRFDDAVLAGLAAQS